MTNRTLTLALAAMTSLAAAPALANGYETRSVEVAYHDLDLTTLEGVQKFDRRVDRAARDVCGLNDIATGTRIPASGAHACYREAKDKIGARVAALVAARPRG